MMETENPVVVECSPTRCEDFKNNQETPGFQVDKEACSRKMRQGRLVFDMVSPPPKEVTSVVTGGKTGSGQPQPLILVLQAIPPSQPSSSSSAAPSREVTPPSGIQLAVSPSSMQYVSGVGATPTSKTASVVLTTPTLSGPPKPKLTKEEREVLRRKRELEREEQRVRREEEREIRQMEKERKEQEKRERQLKREQEAKERAQRKAWEEKVKEMKRERKEAEKKKVEEERRKLEQEKERVKTEKLRIAQQKKERMMGFFVRKPKEETVKPTKQEYSFITPFSLKANMTLATHSRPPLQSTTEFDNLLQSQNSSVSVGACVQELWKVSPGIRCPSNSQDDDVIEIKPDDNKVKHRFKLLQFHKNYRPAYYGTWRKRSSHINPRNPFTRDESLLDYSVDSDEEWEEEDPGESISNSEGEGEEDGDHEDEEEDDDGFFVPHGYLSDGEGDDELPAGFDPTGNMEDSENRKKKMADKAKAWETEFVRRCQPLKPIKIGCTWTPLSDSLSKDESFLQQFAAVALVDLPVPVDTRKEKEQKEGNDFTGGSSEQTRMPVPDEAVPDLIRLMHKSCIGVARIIKTFRIHWGAKKLQTTPTSGDSGNEDLSKSPVSSSPNNSKLENASGISKRQVERKIHEIAVKASRPPTSKPRWYVHDAVLAKYDIDPDNFTPLNPLPSPQTKMNSDPSKQTASANTQSTTSCGTVDAASVKRKMDIISLLASQGKSPTSKSTCPPQPKRVKLELHVNKPTKSPSKGLPNQVSQGILSLLASLVKSTKPDCPPQPKTAQMLLHTIKQTPSGKDSESHPHQRKTDKIKVSDLQSVEESNALTEDVRQKKRCLEFPVSQSAAKRLCLEDAMNRAVKDETKSTGSDDKGVEHSLVAGLLSNMAA